MGPASLFASAHVSSDADVSGIASALADIEASSRLRSEHAARVAAERAAEASGDEAALVAAMAATDAWTARTAGERVRLFGRGGWWS